LVPLAVTENVAEPKSGAAADDARGPASTAPEAELVLEEEIPLAPAAPDPAAFAVALGTAADPAATLEENDS
jgi:hypothetical protein